MSLEAAAAASKIMLTAGGNSDLMVHTGLAN